METDSLPKAQSRTRRHMWLRAAAIAAYVVTLAACTGLILASRAELVDRDEIYEGARITTLRPGIHIGIYVAAGTGALALFSIGIASICRRRLCFGVVTLLAGPAVCICALFISFMCNPTPWKTKATLKAPDGHTYYFIDSSLLQGHTMALARLESTTLLTRTVKSLGTNNVDSLRSWASVIRPIGAPKFDYGQLYLNDSGIIIGIRYASRCYFAYDTLSGTFYGHGAIEQISPFVLMGPNTRMCQADVEAVIERVTQGAQSLPSNSDIRITEGYLAGKTTPGYPSGKTLSAGLTHPNTRVRELAKHILEIHEAGLERAKARVRRVPSLIADLASEDPRVRWLAARELGSIGSPDAIPAVPALAIATKDQDKAVRIFAIRSLGEIGEAGVPALVALLNDKDVFFLLRDHAIMGLIEAGPAAWPAVPALIEALKDENSNIRGRAAAALGSIGPAASAAIPALKETLNDKRDFVARKAALALRRIESE